MTMRVKAAVAVVEEATMEHLFQVHYRQELYNKKWKILSEGQIFSEETPPDVSPDNTREQNSRIIARKNQEIFQNRQNKEREKELSNIPKGIINKRKSSINFNFPDTPPYTPSYPPNVEDDFSRYLAPSDFSRYLEPSPHFFELTEPREISFYFLMEINLKVYRH